MLIKQDFINVRTKKVLLLVRCGSISVFIQPVVMRLIARRLLGQLTESSITAWLIEEAVCEMYLMQTSDHHELLRIQITNLEHIYSLLKHSLLNCLTYSLKTQETILRTLPSGILECNFNNDTLRLIVNYEQNV